MLLISSTDFTILFSEQEYMIVPLLRTDFASHIDFLRFDIRVRKGCYFFARPAPYASGIGVDESDCNEHDTKNIYLYD